ncbi:MAG: flagellar motor protein MotB [Nitrospirota bacterium]
MADKSKIIIIKKIKKGHDGHHGGSWKVAYADFVTAMMAFFLLMWLLAMVSPEKRAAVSYYFKHFNLFEKENRSSGQSFMQESTQIFEQAGGDVQSSTAAFGKGGRELTAEELKEKLKKDIEEKLKALKDQAIVDTIEGGVRVQLVDMDGRPMFQSGSAQLTDRAREILRLLSENMRDLPNRIAIEGHTDAAPLKTGQITNWELSTQRASTARRELEAYGVDPGRVARVVGYADTELLLKDKPHDPRNRRISIILLQQKDRPAAPAHAPAAEPKAVSAPEPPAAVPAAPLPQEKPPARQIAPVRQRPPAAAAQDTGTIRQPQQRSAPQQEHKSNSLEQDIGIREAPIDMRKPSIAPDLGRRKEH